MLWLKVVQQLLRLRFYSPRPWEGRGDRRTYQVEEAGDTGGGWYRPTHRKQDPSVDPAEPKNESSSAGNDHGWANCSMASGAMALDFHTQGRLKKWGGDLRHKQGDLSGGTDLYDVADAWAAYGETLKVRTGAGWSELEKDRNAGRFLIVQGEGNVPGSESFTGGHACAVGPETNADGKWLFGDPLASGWQWISEDSIKTWMKAWHSGYAWARSDAHPPAEPEPQPEPEPEEDMGYTQEQVDEAVRLALASHDDALVLWWSQWLQAPRATRRETWDIGAWSDLLTQAGADPCAPRAYATWAREPEPFPIADAASVNATLAVWGQGHWRESHWK